MKPFVDTSILVATFYGEHEHHESSLALFLRCKKPTACTAAHCLAEVYSVLTGMPGKERASPDEALLFLGDIRERLTIITLDEKDYVEVMETAAASNVVGGGIYDALLARCALKAKGRDDIHLEREAFQSPRRGRGGARQDALSASSHASSVTS